MYTFGILRWTNSDLGELYRMIRRPVTKHGSLDFKSAVKRLYVLIRTDGGGGLLNVKRPVKTKFIKDRLYFPLNLHNTQEQPKVLQEKKNLLVHGKYPTTPTQKNIYTARFSASRNWRVLCIQGGVVVESVEPITTSNISCTWISKMSVESSKNYTPINFEKLLQLITNTHLFLYLRITRTYWPKWTKITNIIKQRRLVRTSKENLPRTRRKC